MNKHISDELPRLLTGDASHDVVMDAAEHLRTCPDCQQELVSAVVAHASLTSAHRFAPEVVGPAPTREPVSADSSPGDAAVVRLHGSPDDDRSDDTEPEADALPDMSSVFDRVRAEAAHAKPARGRRGLLAVAAAAVVVIGGGSAIGYAITDTGSGSGDTVAMHRFDEGHGTGNATIKGDTVTLDATSLPRLRSSQRYEVWLTDAARKHMYSIGFLGDKSSATFTVKPSYLARFSAIEVSKQSNGKVDYSGVSVLRGSYA